MRLFFPQDDLQERGKKQPGEEELFWNWITRRVAINRPAVKTGGGDDGASSPGSVMPKAGRGYSAAAQAENTKAHPSHPRTRVFHT